MHNEWIIDALGISTIYENTHPNRKQIKHYTFLNSPKILATLIKLKTWEEKQDSQCAQKGKNYILCV